MFQPGNRILDLAIVAAGVLGFVAFLVAAFFLPAHASQLRWLAMIWFFGFGAIKLALGMKPRG
jgi:hypothetical protein